MRICQYETSKTNEMKQTILYCFLLCWLTVYPIYAVTHRALVFGLGMQLDPAWGKIHGDNDIAYVVRMLKGMGYTDIQTLKNEQATKQAMVRAFTELEDRCRPGDKVYIHYSGHGQLMTDLNGDESFRWNNKHSQWDESWIPYDAYMYYGQNDRGEKHLGDDEVASFMQRIRQRIGKKGELIVVVDACHSGDATCGDDEECIRGVDTKFVIPKDPNATIEKPIEEQWLTISACKPYQLSTELKELQIGKLTYALYTLGKGLFNQDNQTIEHLLKEVIKQHKGRLPQTPMVSGHKK